MAEQLSPRPAARRHPLWSPLLRGRQQECAALDGLLHDLTRGQSSVLVLRGEAGIGKSALLDHLAERATDRRLVRAVGVQAEMELAYAGLHQLCAPLLQDLGELPVPQRDALRVAFGLQPGATPDPFLVALAALGLVSQAAGPSGLVCLIDDAQWLDHASLQALAFVARRLGNEPVVMVFALRGEGGAAELGGLPELSIGGIPDQDARLLLAAVVPGRLDERVADRIVAETRGNPLALLELPRGMTPPELAGGFGLPDAGALAGHLEGMFAQRVRQLPAGTRRLLLVAAAEPMGDVTLLWRAIGRLDLGPSDAAPAEAAGLVEFGVRVRFRHPLVRSAVYRTAEPDERRQAHRTLAAVTVDDPDRLAWHLAHAAAGLDEPVAAQLEHSADRARQRGGAAAAAAFLQRATELTPDPARRGARALAAARAQLDAAAPDAASELLATARLCPLEPYQRAQLGLLGAQVAFLLRRGSDALPLLLAAATRLARFDTALTRETYLEAFAAAIFAGDQGDARALPAVAAAALVDRPSTATPAPTEMPSPTEMPPAADAASPIDGLVRGLATVFTDGLPAAVPALRAALESFRLADDTATEVNRWLWLASRIASDLFDRQTWDELSARGVRVARETGSLSVLPIAASYRAGVHLHAGEFEAASALMDEAGAISVATGTAPLFYTTPLLAAYRGDEAVALPMLAAAERTAADSGQGLALSMLGCARAVLFNGLARYEEALAAAEQAAAHDGLATYAPSLIEVIEAAVRSGRPAAAAGALDQLAQRCQAGGSDWALGLLARSRALLSTDRAAETLYQEAISRLEVAGVALHMARAQLVYGEWLRRENRRLDARRQLTTAIELFDGFGALAFAERARRELLATGETARRRHDDTRQLLTPQEAQIARLAADGLTNPEIGARLFISARTVEYHLHKVFPKLGIGSRRELRRTLG
ncbi:ATP-binding protein [Nakamurella lactea]|uniref:ATP-binding protein n=1 Tax=Nakamurella lactea TaxID=459515 RepID=UPI0003FE88B0|nr:helix-turn-helix transcriptional regulator [Nakamurella lactea]